MAIFWFILLCSCLVVCRQFKDSSRAAILVPEPAPILRNCTAGNMGLVHTPLRIAIWRADIASVKAQIKSGANLNVLIPVDCTDATPKEEITPLIYAIDAPLMSGSQNHGEEIVELLLESGADPNFHDPRGESPLEIAGSAVNLSLVKILLKHKARVEYQDKDGETAFLKAAQRDNGIPVMEELIRAGANIHAVNSLGDNAIALAAWQHHLENVKLLAQLGVDACAKNNAGETAIDMAETNLNDDPGKQEIISLLKSKCGG